MDQTSLIEFFSSSETSCEVPLLLVLDVDVGNEVLLSAQAPNHSLLVEFDSFVQDKTAVLVKDVANNVLEVDSGGVVE